jgi:hypothetical protein
LKLSWAIDLINLSSLILLCYDYNIIINRRYDHSPSFTHLTLSQTSSTATLLLLGMKLGMKLGTTAIGNNNFTCHRRPSHKTHRIGKFARYGIHIGKTRLLSQ